MLRKEEQAKYTEMEQCSLGMNDIRMEENEETSSFDVIIPCYKPGEKFRKLLKALEIRLIQI